jgi:hypothetical protein
MYKVLADPDLDPRLDLDSFLVGAGSGCREPDLVLVPDPYLALQLITSTSLVAVAAVQVVPVPVPVVFYTAVTYLLLRPFLRCCGYGSGPKCLACSSER